MAEGEQADDKAQLYMLLGELNSNTKSALDKLDKLESNLQQNYVPRPEIESRMQRLENGPKTWIPIVVAAAALVWSIISPHLK